MQRVRRLRQSATRHMIGRQYLLQRDLEKWNGKADTVRRIGAVVDSEDVGEDGQPHLRSPTAIDALIDPYVADASADETTATSDP